MTSQLIIWILLTVLFTLAMSFYSMQEMAIISCNRLQLEMAARNGNKKASIIIDLLKRPSILFGATLMGVNTALVLSSESARQVFWNLGLNPNLSAFFQIPYVLIFGELVPMFVARRFPNKIAQFGTGIIWITSRIIQPLFTPLHALLNLIFKKTTHRQAEPHLVRDELFHLLEEHHFGPSEQAAHRLTTVTESLITFKGLTLKDKMIPLNHCLIVSKESDARAFMQKKSKDFALIKNSVDFKLVTKFEQPLLSLESTLDCFDALLRLQRSHISYAKVLGSSQETIGVISLHDLITAALIGSSKSTETVLSTLLDKTVDAATSLTEFTKRYSLKLPETPAHDFQELFQRVLNRSPKVGDTIRFGQLDIEVTSSSLKGAKTVRIRTHRG